EKRLRVRSQEQGRIEGVVPEVDVKIAAFSFRTVIGGDREGVVAEHVRSSGKQAEDRSARAVTGNSRKPEGGKERAQGVVGRGGSLGCPTPLPCAAGTGRNRHGATRRERWPPPCQPFFPVKRHLCNAETVRVVA